MIHLGTIDWLLNFGARHLLDIGCQNLIRASADEFADFLQRHGLPGRGDSADLARRSVITPGQPTLYLAELLECTGTDYVAYDVCPGPRSRIFDLNMQSVPWRDRRRFDLVLNCGTSEHVINQLNVFRVIHDACRVGGLMYHQVPASGRVDHGYFAYRQRFFEEIASANSYEIVLIEMRLAKTNRDGNSTSTLIGVDGIYEVPNCSVSVVYRKTARDKFRLALEVATRHAEPDGMIAARYRWKP